MIFFIGMPGSGKSFWGSTIAAAHGLPFVDLDKYIEDKIGMSIADYFYKYSELEFRKREQESLMEVVRVMPGDCVIACGGGTPIFKDNLQKMKEAGCTVYVRASLSLILRRLENSSTRRPLLEGKDKATALLELYDNRQPFYSQADYTFDVESISLANFDKIIHSCTNRH